MNTFSNEKRQYFYEEIKARFYLRKPKSKRPTRIFLVVYIGGKQHRYPTQVRVYPSQWNSKKQLAVVSNVQSEQDNRNNKIVNEHLTKLRHYFSEYIEYICNNDVTDIAKTLKQFIYRGMAKKNKKKNIYDVIPNALEHYHKYVKPSIKDSTKRQNESLLSEFRRFLDTLPSKDRTMQILSQRGLNRYKQYLIDKMELSKTDDKMRNFGVGQLNRCGAIIALLINRVLVEKEDGINPVVWNKVDDPRREDQIGHIPLLDNEVVAIENCSGLTDVEEEYRNLFLLQLECGQRVSDMAKILTGKYNVEQGKKYRYIVLSTIKENIKAYVPLTPRMTMLLERAKAHKLVDPIEFEKKTKGKGNGTYNEAIRRIAKKAELCREIVKINASQTEVRKPLYETITSHDARCTFITNMIKKGVSPERLCKMTGHASDEMIKRVYAQLSDADEINRIESDLYSDVEEDGAPVEDVPPTTIAPPKTVAVKGTEPSPYISDLPFYNQTDAFDRDSYIKKLEDVAETAITRIESLLDINTINLLLSGFEEEKRTLKKDIGNYCPKSKGEAIHRWMEIEEEFAELASQQPDSSNGVLDIVKSYMLRTIIDNSKKQHAGKDVINTLKGFLKDIYEDNPMVEHFQTVLNSRIIIFPYVVIIYPIAEVARYVLYNRQVVDDFLGSGNNYTLPRIPDWKLVYRELCKFPPLKLEAIICNTNCPQDVNITLYKSIISRNVDLFANTIQSHDREAYELIEIAYLSDYLNSVFEAFNQYQSQDKFLLNFDNAFDYLQDSITFKNPFLDFNNDSPLLELSDNGNRLLALLDRFFEIIEQLKKRAYSKEITIFNKLLRRINDYPELKEAFEVYKNKKILSLDPDVSDGSESKKTFDCAFEDLVIFKSEIDYSNYNPHELLTSLNSNISKRGDSVFKEFINFLVHSSCIDNDDAIKQLLIYRLTGRCRPKGELGKIPWNPDKLNELAYVIMYFTARAKGKYEKVPYFFEGPRFPDDISMIRTTAINAPKDFRTKLNKLYPDVFIYKG